MDYNLCTNHYLGNLLYAIFQLLTLDLQLDFQCAKMQLLLLHLGSLFPKEGIQMLYSLQYKSLHIHKKHSYGASLSGTPGAVLVLVRVQGPSSPVHSISFSMWLVFPSHLVS